MRISGAGRREIAAIRAELQWLRNSGLDIFTIQQRVDDAAARFLYVLRNEVYPIGRPRSADASTTTTTAPGSTDGSTTTTTAAVSSTPTTAPADSVSTTTMPFTTTTTAAP